MAIWSKSEARRPRKACSLDSLRRCDANSDLLMICTVARLCWEDRRIKKAREWLERAVSVGLNLVDACWCQYHLCGVRLILDVQLDDLCM